MQGLFGGFASGGHDGFVVVKRDGVKNDGINKGFVSAQQRFGTARAFSGVQIHHRRTTPGQRSGHLGGE